MKLLLKRTEGHLETDLTRVAYMQAKMDEMGRERLRHRGQAKTMVHRHPTSWPTRVQRWILLSSCLTQLATAVIAPSIGGPSHSSVEYSFLAPPEHSADDPWTAPYDDHMPFFPTETDFDSDETLSKGQLDLTSTDLLPSFSSDVPCLDATGQHEMDNAVNKERCLDQVYDLLAVQPDVASQPIKDSNTDQLHLSSPAPDTLATASLHDQGYDENELPQIQPTVTLSYDPVFMEYFNCYLAHELSLPRNARFSTHDQTLAKILPRQSSSPAPSQQPSTSHPVTSTACPSPAPLKSTGESVLRHPIVPTSSTSKNSLVVESDLTASDRSEKPVTIEQDVSHTPLGKRRRIGKRPPRAAPRPVVASQAIPPFPTGKVSVMTSISLKNNEIYSRDTMEPSLSLRRALATALFSNHMDGKLEYIEGHLRFPKESIMAPWLQSLSDALTDYVRHDLTEAKLSKLIMKWKDPNGPTPPTSAPSSLSDSCFTPERLLSFLQKRGDHADDLLLHVCAHMLAEKHRIKLYLVTMDLKDASIPTGPHAGSPDATSPNGGWEFNGWVFTLRMFWRKRKAQAKSTYLNTRHIFLVRKSNGAHRHYVLFGKRARSPKWGPEIEVLMTTPIRHPDTILKRLSRKRIASASDDDI